MAGKKYIDFRVTSNYNLEELLSTNPVMREKLEHAIRVVMWDARDKASEGLKQYMRDSAHDAHKAIRNIVYKKVIGGELNILNVKRALRQGKVSPSWRGRTADTSRILSYTGIDRGFILRFVNDSTNERWTKNMDGHPMYRKDVSERPRSRKYVYPHQLGGRGGAARRNGNTIGMFEKEGTKAMAAAAMELQELVEKIYVEKFG